MLKRYFALMLAVALVFAGVATPVAAAPAAPATATSTATTSAEPTTAATTVTPATPVTAQSPELKGVWVTTVFNLDYPSKATADAALLKKDADAILDHVKAMGLNAVFLQIRPSGDAFYQSSRFPWSSFLTGQQGLAPKESFDPLAYWIEGAHNRGLQLHAWLNPYRVTTAAAKAGVDPYAGLSANNPAKLNPQWTVLHTDGKIYYNPGIPEVRNLIIAEIVDIVSKYAVDGIHFDDYFYPGASFADQSTYKQYGGGLKIEDWRRDNNTALIRDTYQTIKAIKPQVAFGVSPFGIWANAKQIPGGSDTAGNQSYFNHYADTKKWVEQGIVDYIMPQLYWQIGYSLADYQKLVAWWHQVVQPTRVKLYIGMAAYRAGNKDTTSPWYGDAEIQRQLTLNRQYPTISGAVFYRYASLKARPSLVEAIQRHYLSGGIQTPGDTTAKPSFPIRISSPSKNISTSLSNYFLAGIADPALPLSVNGQPITLRSPKGYFGIFLPLAKGVNTFVFTQGSESITRIIGRGVSVAGLGTTSGTGSNSSSTSGTNSGNGTVVTLPPTTSTTTTPAKPKSLAIELVDASLYPQKDEMWQQGEKISLTATAPVGATVIAYVGGTAVPMTPKVNGQPASPVAHTNYSAAYTLPPLGLEQNELPTGRVRYQMIYEGRVFERESPASLTILGPSSPYWAQVKEDTTDTYPYQQTAKGAAHFLAKGMLDNITAQSGTMVRLASGYWLKQDAVDISKRPPQNIAIQSALYEVGDRIDRLSLMTDGKPAAFTRLSGSTLTVDLGPATSMAPLQLPPGALATGAQVIVKDQRAKLILTVPTEAKLAGHWVELTKNGLIVHLKRPFVVKNDSRPLMGLKVMIDPGHGGKDPGAVSFQGVQYSEKHINLDASLKLRTALQLLGAEVVMTRTQDIDMTLQQRLRLSYQAKPDFFISMHANSIGPEVNIANTFGFSAHYSDPIALKSSNALVNMVTKNLTRKSRGVKRDNFYVVRGTWAPSVLLETGFVPHPLEYDWLSDSTQQLQLADALAKGILEGLK